MITKENVELIMKPMLCWDINEDNAKKCFVVSKLINLETDYCYKAICNDGTMRSFRYVKPLLQTEPRKIEDGLEVGDIICKNRNTRKVVSVVGEVIIVSDINNHDSAEAISTLNQFIKLGYKLEPKPETAQSTRKMTVAEISKLVGETVEIVEG